ncbi:metal-binding protein [Alicyclobacillus contaminans]|uniref:heavy-metal-associated domain-containing protein n=1 Tax=Alicyclobacillus contaminans TaxID=392016 RepID=UPI00041E23CC|nr:heavy-metal-associated domain-containing protein [Alicyclobacillus contaminans]GMA49531.1 metal-binding protein [Alicyclobacillus contaminans]
MVTFRFGVDGMTCEHCGKAVERALSVLPGVRSVQVDVASGAATVVAESECPSQWLKAAVEEAGYRLVGDSAVDSVRC